MESWELKHNAESDRLELHHPQFQKPFYQDFVEGSLGYRRQKAKVGKKHILARAVGYKGTAFSLWDLTAGFGQDSLFFWQLGLNVTSVERHKAVFALLQDAHRRLEAVENLSHWNLVEGDAFDILRGEGEVEVIFLDPMFPETGKSALASKPLQLLQELLGSVDTQETESLVEACLMKARDRVVVKRPLHAPPVFDGFQYQFTGKSIRYDMYLAKKEK